MFENIRPANVLEAPYINIKVKVVSQGTTNGKPNIKYKDDYIVAPSAKKIATYIKNKIFGSDLVTQTEGLSINWLMPVLSQSLENAIYQKESFIYLHKFDDKVYLEYIKKTDIHDLKQVFDKFISGIIIQDFETEENKYVLKRYIEITDSGSIIKFEVYEDNRGKLLPISLARFNKLFGTNYKSVHNLPYEVIVNLDVGEDFFRDSKRLLNEEMIVINTIAEEVEKTKTRIVTSEHYSSGDLYTKFNPRQTGYNVRSIAVNNIADYFTLVEGDKEHQIFEFLQGDVRTKEYEETVKFYDYQIIQMAGLSPSSFGYEKDAYMNTANVELSANATEMTIEAIKKQIEPQINNLIKQIVILQQSQNITINALPLELDWDFGSDEKFDDMKKLKVLQEIQRTASVPYSTRAKIITPILNKLIDEKVEVDNLVKEWNEEQNKMTINYGEL